jgi:hypothetical protein
MRRLALVGAALALAGCGSGGDDEAPSPKFPAGARTVSYPQFGISFARPADWTTRGSLPAPVIVRAPDGPASCLVTLTQPPDLSTRAKRLAYARSVAARRSANGRADVREEPARGITGAGLVAPGRGSHAAVFAASGVGLSVLCSTRPDDFASAERDAFAPLIASLAFRADPLLQRAQAAVSKLAGVTGASVRRVNGRLSASLKVSAEADPEAVLRSAVAALIKVAPRDDLGVSATGTDLRDFALARWDGRAHRGTVQIGTSPPRALNLG